MKARYFLVLFAVILLSGCAAQETAQQAEQPTIPEAPAETPEAPAVPVEAPAAEETAPAKEEETKAAEPSAEAIVEVTQTGDIFSPKELTLKKGAKVTFKAIQGKHLINIRGKTINGGRALEEGASVDYTFNDVGKIKVMDMFFPRFYVTYIVEE